jgi:hypothetical protein
MSLRYQNLESSEILTSSIVAKPEPSSVSREFA